MSTVVSDTNPIEISSANVVIAKKDVALGYSITICVKCTNGAVDTQIDNWSISQDSPCASVMSKDSSTIAVDYGTLSYDPSSTTSRITSGVANQWDTYFQNQETALCPITSCGLY